MKKKELLKPNNHHLSERKTFKQTKQFRVTKLYTAKSHYELYTCMYYRSFHFGFS